MNARQARRSSNSLETAIAGVFFATGVAALIYQIVWQRLLTLFLGGDLRSVTIVVAAFMGGLGFGNLVGGYAADRLSARLRLWLFAVCETGVATFALLSSGIYYDVLYVRFGTMVLTPGTSVALIFAVTLLPTFLMGMSLPLLAAGFGGTSAPSWIPKIYGFNTLGAACGAIATVAVLLHQFDFRTTLNIGASISAASVLVAVVLARRAAPDATPLLDSTPNAIEPGLSFRSWLLLYALSGFTALSLEIVWFRSLGVMLKSNALTFGYLLFFYLGGLALGSLFGSDPRLRGRNATRLFLTLQGVTLILAVVTIVLMSQLAVVTPMHTYVSGTEPTYDRAGLFAWMYGAVPFVLIVPGTTLMGVSFCAMQRAIQTDAALVGQRVGWLQTANILGSMTGAIVTGVWLLSTIGSTGTLRVLVLVGLGLLGIATWQDRRVSLSRAAWVFVGVCAVATVPSGPSFWSRLVGGHSDRVVVGEDGSGVVVLREDPEATEVFLGGLSQSWLPYGGIHTALGAIPTMLHPNPVRVAVIGLASGDTMFAAGSRPETQTVVGIEIMSAQVPALTALAARQAYPALTTLLTDPRMRHVAADGRAYLRHSAEMFDVIEADALFPRGAAAGNMYSVEYFELLRSRLAPGGLAVSWLPTPRTFSTFVSVFPYVVRVASIGIGSMTPLTFDLAAVEARLRDSRVRGYFMAGHIDVAAALKPYLALPAESFDGESRQRAIVSDLNRDLFPRDEFGVPWRH